MGNRALVLGATMITEKGSKSQREKDSCSPPQGLIFTSTPRSTPTRSSSRTPMPPIRGTPRDSMDRGRGEETGLGGLIEGALDGDVRHGFSFVLSEIDVSPHGIPAQLTSAEQLGEGPPC